MLPRMNTRECNTRNLHGYFKALRRLRYDDQPNSRSMLWKLIAHFSLGVLCDGCLEGDDKLTADSRARSSAMTSGALRRRDRRIFPLQPAPQQLPEAARLPCSNPTST